MRTPTLTFLLAALIILSACNRPVSEKLEEVKELKISDSYLPHRFENDQRAEKIRTLADQIQKKIEQQSADRKIPGIAYGIVVDNELVLTANTGLLNIEDSIPVTSRSSFRIASMTKSFTAMAILKLRDDGLLSLSDPVTDYVSELGEVTYLTSDAPPISIENLLTMTAGFPEDNPWGDRQLDEPDQMLTDLLIDDISFSNPGSYKFEYSNTGYALLGLIISRLSGQPYQEYIRKNIFEPLGMNETYWEYDSVPHEQLAIGYRWEDEQWKLEPMLHDGSYGAMGGLITSIEDFSKYVSFHLSAWPPRNEPDNGPLKRSSVREMHVPKFPRLIAQARNAQGDPCPIITGYGYGLGISENCDGLKWIRHGGALPGFGSSYIFLPDHGIGVMAFGNLTYTGPMPNGIISQLIIDSLGVEARKLPVSDILKLRKEQIVEMIRNWDEELENSILAENFYLDQSREHRMKDIQEVLEKAGAINYISELDPENQLRGTFSMEAENGTVKVFFTLTPEQDPKVQQLDVWLEENEK